MTAVARIVRDIDLAIESTEFLKIYGKTAEQIDELRAFRHVFRNMYRKNLDPEKLRLLQKRLPDIVDSWRSAISSFVKLLTAV